MRTWLVTLLAAVLFAALAGGVTYVVLHNAYQGERECEAALRVGMGDSGAAEQSALMSPACAALSDDDLARVRARVEIRLLRQVAAV